MDDVKYKQKEVKCVECGQLFGVAMEDTSTLCIYCQQKMAKNPLDVLKDTLEGLSSKVESKEEQSNIVGSSKESIFPSLISQKSGELVLRIPLTSSINISVSDDCYCIEIK